MREHKFHQNIRQRLKFFLIAILINLIYHLFQKRLIMIRALEIHNYDYNFVLGHEDIGKHIADQLDLEDLLFYRVISVRIRWILELVLIDDLNTQRLSFDDINVKTLDSALNFFTDCYRITRLTSFIDLQDKDLEKIAGSFTQLRYLKLFDCKNITLLHEKSFKSLTSLALINNTLQDADLEKMASFLTQIKHLNLWGSGNITTLGTISSLSALTSLNLTNCKGIKTIRSLTNFTKLENLNLFCSGIREHSFLKECQSLKALTLETPVKIPDFNTYIFTNLTDLNLEYSNIDELPCLGESLTTFNLKGSIPNLNALGACTNITDLTLIECQKIENFSFLKKLKLEKLIMSSNTHFDDLEVLENSRDLAWLDILACEIRNPELLKNFQNLTYLVISNMPHDFNFLGDLPKLKDLSLIDFSDIQFVERCTSLENLGLVDCIDDEAYVKTLEEKGINIYFEII